MIMPDTNLDLSVTRYIDAPPARVWEIMTRRLPEWWCPRPWTAEIVEQDWRPGGRSAVIMRGPNGEAMPNEGIFLSVEPGRQFAFTDAITADLRPQGPFMIGIFAIAAEGEGTRYTATARHWTAEALAQHRDMGFEPGWSAAAAQLAELCEHDTAAA